MSVDKLVEEANKPDQVKEKQTKRSTTAPIYDAQFYSDPKTPRQQCEARDEPRLPGHVVFGVGATLGLTRMVMPGLRFGVGRTFGPIMFELDAHVLPPVIKTEWDTGAEQQRSARSQAYLGSFAVCARRAPLIGCAVAMGGVAGYEYDKPVLDDERFAPASYGGVFFMGVRAGVELPLNNRLTLRFDVDAQLPIYGAKTIPEEKSRQTFTAPVLTGFVSVVPSF
jgi:hypothetical protein